AGVGDPAVGPADRRRAARRVGDATRHFAALSRSLERRHRSWPSEYADRGVRASTRHSARRPHGGVRPRERRRHRAALQAGRHPLDARRQPRGRRGAHRLPDAARVLLAMSRGLRRGAYVLALCGLTLAVAEGILRVWYPAPTRHYVWPPNLRIDFAPTDAATPGGTGPRPVRTKHLRRP